MGMIPEEFFETFVLGNYVDCQQNSCCIRRAFNAAVSASHLADHYFKFNKKYAQSKVESFKTIGDFVAYLSKNTSGCFQDIRSISNAYKHLYEDPRNAAYSTISSTGAIESIYFVGKNMEVKMLEKVWPKETKPHNIESKVFFTRKDDKRIEFLPTLDRVIKFWEKLLI